jgi:hypothetical protein
MDVLAGAAPGAAKCARYPSALSCVTGEAAHPIAEKIIDVIEALRREPGAFEGMPPAQRRVLAETCRYVAAIADPDKPRTKDGVLGELRAAGGGRTRRHAGRSLRGGLAAAVARRRDAPLAIASQIRSSTSPGQADWGVVKR